MTKLLIESTTVPTATDTGRWRAVLITPGKGSSGFYSEALLKEHGPKALRKGAKSFVTHNRLENGEPDPFQMWGFLAEDAYYEEGVGLVGEIEVLPSWREKVAEVAPHTALSVYVSGEIDRDGNVTELSEDGQNGVDLVVYPGRPGSSLVEQLYESAKTSVDETENGSAPADRPTKRTDVSPMELKELAEKVDTLTETVQSFIASATPLLENLKPIETPDEVNLAATVEAVVESKLPKASRAAILESVAAGAKIEDAIKAEKARVDEIRAELSESSQAPVGRTVEGQDKKFSLSKLSEAK